MLAHGDRANDFVEHARANGFPDLTKATHSQGHSTVQYGYSLVTFGPNGLGARREGSADPVGKRHESHAYDEEWREWALGVLRSGRTVECGRGVGLRQIKEYVHFQTVDFPFNHLAKAVRDPRYPWDLDPDYQRAHVWTTRQRELFLGHLFENGRAPLIWLNEGAWPWGAERWQVIDGKQRITSCLMFLDGEVAAELADGCRIWWRDFNEIDRRSGPTIRCALVSFDTRVEVLRFYLKLNRGGTVHTDEEIARVRGLLADEGGE